MSPIQKVDKFLEHVKLVADILRSFYMTNFHVEVLENHPEEAIITGADTNNDVLVIPETVMVQGRERTVRQIAPRAFEGKSFSRIDFPASLQIIGNYAFAGNDGIRSLEFPNNSELLVIDHDAFRQCSSLVTAHFPSSLRVIGNRSFMNCVSLQRVWQDSESIEQRVPSNSQSVSAR